MVARELGAEHGDLAAQVATYGLLLRRWEPSVALDRLIGQWADARLVARAEAGIDRLDARPFAARCAAEGKDPAVYLYEEFVRACDPAGARRRGVHYSPPEVVAFITRGADAILREEFGESLGDAVVLDPCCGIGTFLRHIDRHISPRPEMVGLEIAPAACALASCLLPGCDIRQADGLEEIGLDARGKTLVVIGNPPYSGHSANPGKLGDLLADYRTGLTERNPKWLQDDYVKFIRMAQHCVETAGRGIVAFITNHSFLSNPTFRAMRSNLLRSFDYIHLIDLHGNARRAERGGNGEADQNVFPIQMGVGISLMVRGSGRARCRVRYAEIRGSRETKLAALAQSGLENLRWREVEPARPFSLFIPHDRGLGEEYERFLPLASIFEESCVGFATARDAFAVDFDRDSLLERVAALRDGSVPDWRLREELGIGDLDIGSARRALREDLLWQEAAVPVLYRPFDFRWAYLSRAVMERPRLPFMGNLLRENAALAIGRAGSATGSAEWDVVFCTDRPTDLNLFRRGGAMLFPRFIYRGGEKRSNITTGSPDPDLLFHYIYALLHSALYRERYAGFLGIDFPRIPIHHDPGMFASLAEMGRELAAVHLMREEPRPGGDANPASAVIGGYDIPRKYIDDRAHRGLTDAERTHAACIALALRRTTDIRRRIDQAIAGSPPWRNHR